MNEAKEKKTRTKPLTDMTHKDKQQESSGSKGGQAQQDLGDIYEEDIIEIEGPTDIQEDENDLYEGK